MLSRSKAEHSHPLSFNLMIIYSEPDLPFFIAHLSLYSPDGMTLLDDRRGNGAFPPDRLLYGNIVSSPHSLRNLHGSPGIYFLFPDVSVRFRGLYSLRISLMRLSRYAQSPFVCFFELLIQCPFSVDASGMVQVGQSGTVLTYTRTRPFEVLERATYIAPRKSRLNWILRLLTVCVGLAQTALTEFFLQQGARMYAFQSSRSRLHQSHS